MHRARSAYHNLKDLLCQSNIVAVAGIEPPEILVPEDGRDHIVHPIIAFPILTIEFASLDRCAELIESGASVATLAGVDNDTLDASARTGFQSLKAPGFAWHLRRLRKLDRHDVPHGLLTVTLIHC